MMSREKTSAKLNNRGAAIITVIVVSAFITIIATTLLYITARNYMTKQTDYQNKISFYEAEEALDKLKAYLVQDVSDAFSYAYADTLTNCLDHTGSANLQSYYAQSYTERLKKVWEQRESDAGTTDKRTQAVRSFVQERLEAEGNTQAEDIANRIISVGEWEIPPEKDKFILKDIKVAYESDEGYSTYIITSIGLELPAFYASGMSDDGDGAYDYDNVKGKTVSLTDCVKYINWQRYD